METEDVDQDLKAYIEETVIPCYDSFDPAHRRDHVETVIRQSLALALQVKANANMAYAIAAYHDTGISEGRKFHHLASGRIIREDQALRRWFTEEEIEMMAQAAEDHRASNGNAPRSVYGMIVAEADRIIVPRTIIERTVQYGLANYPELDKSEQYTRAKTHLQEKYGEGGYLKLWMPESPNARRLEELRTILKDREQLDRVFEEVYKELKENVIGK